MTLVSMERVSKSFGSVQALSDINFSIRRAEVIGLVGDNAAGKSTLIKILSGAYRPDEGVIWLVGDLLYFRDLRSYLTPASAREFGIETVYQDLALVDCLDVTANVYLGRELHIPIGPIRVLDKAQMRRNAERLLNSLKVHVPAYGVPVGSLSGGQRQAVAIARAIAYGARLVILDEPTAALSAQAIDQVHFRIRQLRDNGVAVILISHRLDDILATCDRAVVLYQGKIVGRYDVASYGEVLRDILLRDMEGLGT